MIENVVRDTQTQYKKQKKEYKQHQRLDTRQIIQAKRVYKFQSLITLPKNINNQYASATKIQKVQVVGSFNGTTHAAKY